MRRPIAIFICAEFLRVLILSLFVWFFSILIPYSLPYWKMIVIAGVYEMMYFVLFDGGTHFTRMLKDRKE